MHGAEAVPLVDEILKMTPRTWALEIGFGTGGSHTMWSMLFENVISVDIDPLPLSLFACTEDTRGSYLVCGDSSDPETRSDVAQILGKRPVDFLFIDGKHDVTVVSDYNMYSPMVRVGGVIAFHDIYQSSVEEFLKELENRPEKAGGAAAPQMSRLESGVARYRGVAYFHKQFE